MTTPPSSTQHVASTAPMLLGVAEAVKALGIGRTLLSELTSRGVIPSVKIRRRRMYRRTDIEAWVEAGCPQPGGEGR